MLKAKTVGLGEHATVTEETAELGMWVEGAGVIDRGQDPHASGVEVVNLYLLY